MSLPGARSYGLYCACLCNRKKHLGAPACIKAYDLSSSQQDRYRTTQGPALAIQAAEHPSNPVRPRLSQIPPPVLTLNVALAVWSGTGTRITTLPAHSLAPKLLFTRTVTCTWLACATTRQAVQWVLGQQ